MSDQIGDEKVQIQYRSDMEKLAKFIDKVFNDNLKGDNKVTGFVLLVFPFGHAERVNYISNSDRVDIVNLFKDQIKRFESKKDE